MLTKKIKVILIISILLLTISIFPNTVFAADWTSDASSFLEAGKNEKTGVNNVALREASSGIYNMFASVGMVITVVVGIMLGITYMMASADDKAKVKESLIPYVVGCIVIFGAFGIWQIIVNTFDGI